MSEKIKQCAGQMAIIVELIHSDGFKDLTCGEFMSAAKLLYENASDFTNLYRALRNGVNYIAQDKDCYNRLVDSLSNPNMPAESVAFIKKQIEKLSETRIVYVKPPRRTQIYLMRNNRNGLTKIGQSLKPKHRERTLQSEEPEISLLKSWPGLVGTEKQLHERFEACRVRGEWFNLNETQIALIVQAMEEN